MHGKKLITTAASFFLAAVVTLTTVSAGDVGAKAAIVIDAATGQTLFEKNADARLGIASTTKVMTALVALENSELDSTVTVTSDAVGVEGSSLYLKNGEKLTLRELLYGLLLESGNDAAVAVAVHVSGSVGRFVELMNRRALELGCENTHFVNPNGLPAKDHYSTARDLAIIMAAAMKDPEFARISSTRTIAFETRTFKNHNKLLWNCDGVIAGKTGYTKSSGRTLVSCAERNGLRLICVTLDDPDDWEDHAALYDGLYGGLQVRELYREGEGAWSVPVVSGTERAVAVAPVRDVRVLTGACQEPRVIVELPKFAYAEVRQGETAGRLRIMDGGRELDTVELVYAATVEKDISQKLSMWERLKRCVELIA